MGISGSIVIYPTKPPPASTPAKQKAIAESIVSAMVESGVLSDVDVASLEHDPMASFATGGVLMDERAKHRKMQWVHYHLMPEWLTPAIGELVYFDTAKKWWNEKDRKKRDLVAIPFVDICVFPKAHPFTDHDGNVVCKTNVLLEFSYEDARLSDEIHRVRDGKHPLLRKLASSLGSPMKWGVVSG